ncbi:MAG: hypothetical protein R3A52_21605 [Polyangiales bacterium]
MRWKLLAGNIVAVLLVGLLGWSLVKGRASDALTRDIEPSVQRGAEMLKAIHAQDDDELDDAVAAQVASDEAQQIFAAESEADRAQRACPWANTLSGRLNSLPSRRRNAELVAVFGADGRLIARNTECSQGAGTNLAERYRSVRDALAGPQGRALHDYINYQGQGWIEVGVAPILREGRVVGGLLVGYTVADSAAQNDARRMGVDVGYLFREGDRYTVQSLSAGQQAEKNQLLAWANSPAGQAAVGSRSLSRLTLGDEEYVATVVPLPGSHSRAASAVVLRSVTDARAPAGDVAMPVLLATLLGLLLVVGYNVYVANYLQRPIEQIEEGLLQVINGNQEYRIQVEHDELGGVVYRVNQLIGALTGEEGDDGSG